MTEKILYRVSENPFDYIGWPSVTKDENGVIYAACSGHRLQHVCPFGQSWMFISDDNGESFTGPVIVNDTVMDDRDTGLTYLGNGRLALTWFSHPARFYLQRDGYMEDCVGEEKAPIANGMAEYTLAHEAESGSFLRISENRGKTWGKKIKVPVTAPHGVVLAPDGGMLYVGKEFRSGTYLENGAFYAMKSLDLGETWEVLGAIDFPDGYDASNVHEAHAVYLSDTDILAALRLEDEGLSTALTYSADGGKTWTKPVHTHWAGSPPHLIKHSSGAVICTYGRRSDPCGECVRISRDNGMTFGAEHYISRAPSSDLGYPATVELDDGSLFSVYYQQLDGDENTSLMCCRWTLDEIE